MVELPPVATAAGEVVRLLTYGLRARNSDRDVASSTPSLAVANYDRDGVGPRRCWRCPGDCAPGS